MQGSYVNITEKGIQANKSKLAEYYHYCQKGSDFTLDMYEKSHPLSPINPVPSMRTHYVATKDLDMTQTRHNSRRTSVIDNKFEHKSVAGEDLTNEEHEGIPTIKRLNPLPKFINHDLKNPRDFEELVGNMTERYIPAILIAPSTPCAKIVVFYHANAEDIGQTYSFCKDINEKLEVVHSH